VLGSCQRIRPFPRPLYILRNKYNYTRRRENLKSHKYNVLRWGIFSPPPNPQAGWPPPVDCPLLFIQYIRSYLHIWRPSRPSATRGRAMPWWQGTRLTWMFDVFECIILCSPGQQPLNTLSWKHRTLFPAYSFIFSFLPFFVFLSFLLCHIPCLYFVLHGLYYTIK
jgi:hypothetical protein